MARDFQGAAFGEQLRREREQRGVALETICATTKLPERHILALEAGAFRDLPGGVFRRGFVRSYLDALGLEHADWMGRFDEVCRQSGVRDTAESGAWTAFAENVKNSRAIQRRRPGLRWVWPMLLLLLVGLAGWSLWRRHTHQNLVPHPPHLKSLKSWVDKPSSR